jgi:hypothetical protein
LYFSLPADPDPEAHGRSRAQGARSVPHSGHATPTYINSVAQRFNATGGAIPLSQWNEPTHLRCVFALSNLAEM